MQAYEGWAPDPSGAHDARYFRQGLPTTLVRDGSVESFDALPDGPGASPHTVGSDWGARTQASASAPGAAPVSAPGSAWESSFGPGSSDFSMSSSPQGSRPRTGRPRRRLVASVAALVVVALTAGLVVTLGGGKSAEAAVIDSVNSTLADRTAHVTMHMSVDSPAAHVSGSGNGSIDFSQNAMQLDMALSEGDQQTQVQLLYIAGAVFEHVAGLDQLIPGKSWISIDLSSLADSSGKDPGALGTGTNPAAMLRLMAQQGNTIVPLGPSTIDGSAVQGYSVTVDPAAVKARLAHANLPSWMESALSHVDLESASDKVYVDGAGLLRRFGISLTESVTSVGKTTVDDVLDLSDYGAPVSVTAPPGAQVVSFEQFIQDALAARGGSTAS